MARSSRSPRRATLSVVSSRGSSRWPWTRPVPPRLAPSGAVPDPTMRAVLYTSGCRAGPPALSCRTDVRRRALREARSAQILTNASTAVLIGPALRPRSSWSHSGADRAVPRARRSTSTSCARWPTILPAPGLVPTNQPGPATRGRRTLLGCAVPWPGGAGPEDSMAALASGWRQTLRGDQRLALVLGRAASARPRRRSWRCKPMPRGVGALNGRWDREQFSPHQALLEPSGPTPAGVRSPSFAVTSKTTRTRSSGSSLRSSPPRAPGGGRRG